jgi:phage I-like protein
MSRIGVYATSPAGKAEPEWIELVPAGKFSGRDGRGPYYLEHPEEVIKATQALQLDAGLPIDYDHATDLAAPQGQPAPAAGWIKELVARDGGLWGRVEWTEHGAAAIATREYRYVSPVFEHDGGGVVMRVLRAALTNNPNLYLKAIASCVAAHASEPRQESSGTDTREDEAEGQFAAALETLREALRLEASAMPVEIVAAALRLAERHSDVMNPNDKEATADSTVEERARGTEPDRAHYVAIEHFQKTARELTQLRAQRLREKGELAVEAAMRAGKIVPAQREWAIEYCSMDPRGFEHFVARQPALRLGQLELDGVPTRAGIGKRGVNPEAIAGVGDEELEAIETAICARLGLRASDYARRKAARPAFGDPIA